MGQPEGLVLGEGISTSGSLLLTDIRTQTLFLSVRRGAEMWGV